MTKDRIEAFHAGHGWLLNPSSTFSACRLATLWIATGRQRLHYVVSSLKRSDQIPSHTMKASWGRQPRNIASEYRHHSPYLIPCPNCQIPHVRHVTWYLPGRGPKFARLVHRNMGHGPADPARRMLLSHSRRWWRLGTKNMRFIQIFLTARVTTVHFAVDRVSCWMVGCLRDKHERNMCLLISMHYVFHASHMCCICAVGSSCQTSGAVQ